MGAGSGFGRAVLVGGVVGVVAVAAAVVALASVAGPSGEVGPVLVVLAAPDEDGVRCGAVIAEVDVRSGGIRLVDPATESRLTGVTYTRVGEAFPFGGGGAVLGAVRAAGLTDADAAVGLDERVWMPAVDRAGGIRVTVPEDLDAFVSGRLERFREGAETVNGERAAALLAASAHVSRSSARRALQETLAAGALRALGREPLPEDGEGGVDSTLRRPALERLWPSLTGAMQRWSPSTSST
ncbi:MAG: hypothetical protein IBX63_04460 [Coriobacteriia bacterium]|nr:hypothetical protein [Coriobacteriia bacterium]